MEINSNTKNIYIHTHINKSLKINDWVLGIGTMAKLIASPIHKVTSWVVFFLYLQP